ncbi:myocardin-related transcription factor B isoform X1 [Anas platyrhynchos]|uniref:Myocardin related transcription factor B n=5 Tax=Anas platyrhynchos TaxID=8839 RepID=A0A493U3U9_ANAPP|nr:myocardin-related transcription factor B isoform X1 [Anas platyrhynchos]XP_027325306.1 myocardin-related transcription factor B isoform X1 [Anas platyrhynchos]XP_027325307.1 myocardin-related transcription factor B isoform X1 [Anas platyrhynchos]XP_027325308.1 myocardin-related transcription factor B isoform X1 [Anas platyrhynchos]XP_027325309.1 myocardin-related transcription factor B isoform X1 [Anas platyrhynchos]XP_027325310.1 myocardin-related transcription factor B isoform X1 [Anas pl|eukprot:XP_027325305.1 myocardin-related transcription factor B isoform X1 [Anas platyrhynchos]
MDHLGTADAEDDSGSLTRLAPSPHSEAVAHEFKELSLQPSQYLPPLNERKNVLQLRLQQRRTREQLVDQGIMPPLKSPAAFHEQIKSLERARTENFLKHKIRSRPDRSELVRMHILEETFAEPSLQATQMKLKRARLADDLNEKIAQRPGPMELVEKNILPVDSSVKEAIIAVGQENYPQGLDDYSFDEDSSDALSPDQPASQESQGSAASPGEPKTSDSPSPVTQNATTSTQYPPLTSPVPEFLKTPSTIEQQVTRSTATTTVTTNTVSATKPGPTLVKQSHPKNPNDKHRSKKCKEPKPRVKKLKYHQYIPPDQKGEKNEPQMDSNYARLLQQQQLFLQLQILSQQQQHYNYQAILPAPLKPLNDKQNNNGNTPLNTLNNNTQTSAANSPRQNSNIPSRKPGPLPSSLDDLKVAELKMELKLRGLPVSGTKTDLIERLKPYQDLNNNGVTTTSSVTVTTSTGATGNTGEVAIAFPVATLNKTVANTVSSFPSEKTTTGPGCKVVNTENISSPLPISPSPSEQSSLSTDDTSMADTFTEVMTMMSPSQFLSTSPLRANTGDDNQNRSSGSISSMEFDVAEKDRKLQEKEKQIEELKRKLEQEQKLVEVLKMQLEVEKRGQQQHSQTSGNSAALEQKQFSAAVKDENALTDCLSTSQSVPAASHSLGQSVYTSGQNPVAKKAVVIKQEIPVAKAEPQNAISQFYFNPQRQPQTAVVAQPQALLTTQGTAQLLLPLSIQGPNSTTSVQLPVGNIKLQAQSQAGVQTPSQIPVPIPSSGLGQTAPQMHAPQSKPNTIMQHALGQTQQIRKVFPPTTSNTVFSYQTAPVTTPSQSFINKTSNSNIHTGSNQAPSMQNGPATPSKPGSPSQAQPYIVQQSLFNNTVSKKKDPPRYEEAIKQTRNIQTSHREISSAHSQQMDDLFDILIKSGEISLPIKEEPSPISKMRPVTANITTMPVNTVISRPPPQIQMAPPPVSLEPTTSLSISLENQLEALLDGTLTSGNEIPQLTSSSEDRESFSLIEDLQHDLLNHSSILDHSHSPMETSDPQFTTNNSCLSLDLPDTNLDNMEWLDITMPSSSSGLTPLSSTAPSMFSTDFLDPQDLQLHWD